MEGLFKAIDQMNSASFFILLVMACVMVWAAESSLKRWTRKKGLIADAPSPGRRLSAENPRLRAALQPSRPSTPSPVPSPFPGRFISS